MNIKKGFTLIELLVVISIIGVLAGLILSNVSGIRERARDVARKSDLDQIKKALRMYYNDFNKYPLTLPVGEFSNGTMVYMKLVPSDPSTSNPYAYYPGTVATPCAGGTDDFRLVAVLENKSDSGISMSKLKCPRDCGVAAYTETDGVYVVCAD